jgi:PIN domain nuclease of toxin-antitoxin system
MRLLLDTHAFLWFIQGNPALTTPARTAIEDRNNDRFLSIASLWEISIKISIGKLNIQMTFTELVEREIYGNEIALLNIFPQHLEELAKLPFHHKDPFDRLIIAQSIIEAMSMVTGDKAFSNYPTNILW